METCPDCRRGPSGIEGHEQLFSQTMTMDQMHFKCRACGRLWVRRYAANGTYTWSAPVAGERMGMDVPGRPGTARP